MSSCRGRIVRVSSAKLEQAVAGFCEEQTDPRYNNHDTLYESAGRALTHFNLQIALQIRLENVGRSLLPNQLGRYRRVQYTGILHED